ncbi:MAG: permease, partial [Synergistaceae bacterium]|nr:permease [Synergistaceae bacterium]
MTSILRREAIYLWYYFTVQLDQIYAYWLAGMAIGSFVSVFGKQKIHALFEAMNGKRLSLFGIVPACLLGIASPLCMYGTIPIAASFGEKGMREDWLASFMMASVLLNPQLIVYSSALGTTALTVRIVSCFMCGIFAGLAVNLYGKITGRSFFTFGGFYESSNRDTDPNILIRYIKNFGRNVKATGGYFLLGIVLSAMFMRYVPAESFARLFGRKNGFGVLMAATIGVPLYACGGGTIPLLQMWLADGMS